MAAKDIDEYLERLDEPRRSTLETLRRMIREILPQAEEGMSYGVPAFRIDGKPIAGFQAAKNHLSYLPHSGSVLSRLAADVASYPTSKGALRFSVDKALPKELVKKLIAARRAELT